MFSFPSFWETARHDFGSVDWVKHLMKSNETEVSVNMFLIHASKLTQSSRVLGQCLGQPQMIASYTSEENVQSVGHLKRTRLAKYLVSLMILRGERPVSWTNQAHQTDKILSKPHDLLSELLLLLI